MRFYRIFNKKSAVLPILPLVLLCGALLQGCSQSRVSTSLEEHEIFSIEYGNFEDELNLFMFSEVGSVYTSFAMRDGFFYIANGEGKKVMELNSYGDLITLLYNDEVNPEPSFASKITGGESNRNATVYPFNQVSAIAVDSRQYIYLVDKLPLERQEQDTSRNQVLSQVVLRFDGNGTFIDYLGQEGPGGTPFPFIRNIYATNDNEVVVVCTTSTGPLVFWFSENGYLRYTIPIEKQNVPDPYAENTGDSWLEVENVVPSYSERKLYVKVDYFSTYLDETSHIQSGVNYDGSMLYALDLESGRYGKPLSIPPYTGRPTEGFSNQTYSVPYEFLGVTETGWFFFILSTEQGFALQMVQSNGQRILTRNIELDRQKCLYYTFSLSNSGILSALLVQNDKAVVDWWRTDNLIQAVIKN